MAFDWNMFSFMWDVYCIPTVLFTVAFSLLVILYLRNRQSDVPPGPAGLPIVGYLPFIGRQPHVSLALLAEKYGDVMCVNICGKSVIHLNSYEAIRDTFSNQGEEYSGVPKELSLSQWLVDWQGITQTEGPVWKEHRRFALHTLRDFGFGKFSLEGRIQQVTKSLLKEMKDTDGKPFDPFQLLFHSVFNVISSLLLDQQYSMDDPEFVELHSYLRNASTLLPGCGEVFASPFSRYFRGFSRRYKELHEIKAGLYLFMKKQIQQHEDTFDCSNLRDYVDVFLEERRRAKEEGTLEKSTFTVSRLASIVCNLFLEGTESTARILHWALKVVMTRKDVQDRLQKELGRAVGKDRSPSWADRTTLSYTEAVFYEILRYSSLVPLVAHSSLEETTLRGYTIPRRSTVLANLWSVHRDPKYWPDPENFDPSRFLDPDEKLDKRDSFIPFSIGKRVCPGESLARMVVFIFLTSILQRFDIRPPEGEESQDIKCNMDTLRSLEPYRLCAISR